MEECECCEKEVDEVCGDGFCCECHVGLSFEDCCDGTWVARQRLKNGWPFEKLKELYPDARI